ncbi:alpha/beta hydrolase [Enterobacter sp. CGMCC 5087]|uniref:alpha/beta hydrolase n=1 Tax=Enterobacter sp. CGMCC 5087 TaxID=2183878 RepID=UPI000D6741F4|nr:alpha/beta hydrolase [Enterobacter sp. CGMCC 5087]PWI77194.1 alpha/beta hydrolase [Enterobacter sp. CGMCC 5087]
MNMTRMALNRALALLALVAACVPLCGRAATLPEMQQHYAGQWQEKHGPLTAAPPPALSALLAMHAGAPAAQYSTLSAREGLATLTREYTPAPDGELRVVNTDVDTGGRRIPVRIYQGAAGMTGRTAPGVLFFIHGGGHLSGSVEVYDPVARHLALATGETVVAVDYRRAPENPYPAGLEDARAVLMQTYRLLDRQHIPYTRQLTLAGDSGGGAFSATLAAELQSTHPGLINRLVLIYPSLDYTLNWPSVKENGTGKLLDEAKVRWYFDQYFRHDENRLAHSPLYMPVTKRFPPVLLFSGGLDPLRDEDFAFVARLKAAGIPVRHVHFPEVVHAYLMLESLVPSEAKATYQAIGAFVHDAERR